MKMSAHDLYERLKATCPAQWDGYIKHEFVRGLGMGTLPQPAFRYYLQQDYLFLIHFARAYGLAAFKADNLADLRRAAGALQHIAENEMALHVGYCAGWGVNEAEMAAMPEDPANMAYTRYVLERGLAGDSLDLAVALAPCIVGYAEVGAWLSSGDIPVVPDNPYQEWIDTYAADDYQEVAWAHASHLDDLMARRGGPGRFERLAQTFEEATRLEIGFWQMGLNAAQ